MLKVIEIFNHVPVSVKVDKNFECEPGQIVSLKLKNCQETLEISDGLYPYGIVDEFSMKNFRNVVYGKVVSINEFINNKLQLHPNIIKKSFRYDFVGGDFIDLEVDFKSGECILPKNHNKNGLFYFYYAYNTLNAESWNTFSTTNIATVWCHNMIVETDMFDVKRVYDKYRKLYIENGFLTIAQPHSSSKCIGFVLESPTFEKPLLRYFFDPKGVIDVKYQ